MDSVTLDVAQTTSGLGYQLDKVAKILKLRDELDLERAGFWTVSGGYDSHFTLDDDEGGSNPSESPLITLITLIIQMSIPTQVKLSLIT